MNVYINGVVVGSEYRIQSAKATDNAAEKAGVQNPSLGLS